MCHTKYSPSLLRINSNLRQRRAVNETGRTTPSNPSDINHISKRVVVSVSLIIVALISPFSAGSAVGFAVQGQLAERKAEVIQGEIEDLEARVDILKGKIKPATFLNAISSLASHDMATAVIYANSVAQMANYYAGRTTTISGRGQAGRHFSPTVYIAGDNFFRQDQTATR